MNKRFNKTSPTQAERGRTPMDAALHHLSFRARTVRETERFLDDQNYGEYEVQQTVDRLQELGYLNDAAFAGEFIRSRLNAKPVSKAKLREQLYAHELPKGVIEEALTQVSKETEADHAVQVAQKYAAQIDEALPPQERSQRLARRLLGRGFSFDDTRRAVQRVLNEDIYEDA